MQKSYENLKCIWMSSGVVEYKLCDKEFECEKCSFDKVIRNKLSNNNLQLDVLNQVIDSINKEVYDNRYFYLANLMYLKKLFDTKYYIGFSPLIIFLFDDINVVSLCKRNKRVNKGDMMIGLEGLWGNIEIKSPINFTCLGQFELKSKMSSEANWFGMIDLLHDDLEKEKIEEIQFNKIKSLLVTTVSNYKNQANKIGETMLDGGKALTKIHQRIGKENYIRLLSEFFN